MDSFLLTPLLVVALTAHLLALEFAPLVITKRGNLKGKYETSRNGNQYEAFLGIKYGHIPRRFEVSVPLRGWSGVLDATEFGIHCAQQALSGNGLATGLEDCLTLNVFTPRADWKKRAVLVFIHGGGYHFGGSSEYGAAYLVDEDIVLVTLNYRLGVLGFLNSGDHFAAGNMGLKDQVLALTWVRENIEYFGGDRNRVTISGNSAGSGSALHLMSSPVAQGLFHGIIAMSATSLTPSVFMESNIAEMKQMGDILQCNVQNNAYLVECLRKQPLESLMLAQKSIAKWLVDFFTMIPTLEIKSAKNPYPLLDEFPEDKLRKRNFAKVPVLMTMTPDEGALIFAATIVRNETLLNSLNDEFSEVAPTAFWYGTDRRLKAIKNKISEEISQFYFENKRISQNEEQNLTNLFTDTWFLMPIQKFTEIMAAQTAVYLGLFTHKRNDFHAGRIFGIEDKLHGVTHCEDLSYLFSSTGHPNPAQFTAALTNPEDIEYSKKFVKLIATFVTTGSPKGHYPNWLPVTPADVQGSKAITFFDMGDENTFITTNPFESRIEFWKELERQSKQ